MPHLSAASAGGCGGAVPTSAGSGLAAAGSRPARAGPAAARGGADGERVLEARPGWAAGFRLDARAELDA